MAYDWRTQHVKEFEEEILQCKNTVWNFLPFGKGMRRHSDCSKNIKSIRRFGIPYVALKPIVRRLVAAAAQTMLPLVQRTKELGCELGLYNHGGWGGDPANLVAVCQYLRKHHNAKHVGIVYNLHHGHGHIADWEKSLQMKPYLLCLNLNGMNDGAEPKILQLGRGQHEATMITAIRKSGYAGPIGILDHRMTLTQRLH